MCFAALIHQREDWWIGWIAEILRTKIALLETIGVMLKEALECNRQEAIEKVEGEHEKITIPLPLS